MKLAEITTDTEVYYVDCLGLRSSAAVILDNRPWTMRRNKRGLTTAITPANDGGINAYDNGLPAVVVPGYTRTIAEMTPYCRELPDVAARVAVDFREGAVLPVVPAPYRLGVLRLSAVQGRWVDHVANDAAERALREQTESVERASYDRIAAAIGGNVDKVLGDYCEGGPTGLSWFDLEYICRLYIHRWPGSATHVEGPLV